MRHLLLFFQPNARNVKSSALRAALKVIAMVRVAADNSTFETRSQPMRWKKAHVVYGICVVCAPPFIRRHAHTHTQTLSNVSVLEGTTKPRRSFLKNGKVPHCHSYIHALCAISIERSHTKHPAGGRLHCACTSHISRHAEYPRGKSNEPSRMKASTHAYLFLVAPCCCTSSVPHDETNVKHRFRRVSISGCVSSRQF